MLKYLDSIICILMTIISIVKSDTLIMEFGSIEKYGVALVVLIIVSIVMLPSSEKADR